MNEYGNFTWKPDVTAEFLRQERLPTFENLPSFVDSNNRPVVMMTTAAATTNMASPVLTATGVSGRQYFLNSNGAWMPAKIIETKPIVPKDECFICGRKFNDKIRGFEKETRCGVGCDIHVMCDIVVLNFAREHNVDVFAAHKELKSKIEKDPYLFSREIVEKSEIFLLWNNESPRGTLKDQKQENILKKPTNEQRLILTGDLHR